MYLCAGKVLLALKGKTEIEGSKSEYSLMVKFLSVIEAAAGSNPVVHVYLVLCK